MTGEIENSKGERDDCSAERRLRYSAGSSDECEGSSPPTQYSAEHWRNQLDEDYLDEDSRDSLFDLSAIRLDGGDNGPYCIPSSSGDGEFAPSSLNRKDSLLAEGENNEANSSSRKRTFSNAEPPTTSEPNSSNPSDREKRPATKICRICGDKAYSYNFNVISCESCKAFFRRNANKDKEIRCPFNDNCDINTVSRRFCQKCRLAKCFQVGMKKEWIMTDVQKLDKRQKIQDNRMRRLAERSQDEKQEKYQKQDVMINSLAENPIIPQIISNGIVGTPSDSLIPPAPLSNVSEVVAVNLINSQLNAALQPVSAPVLSTDGDVGSCTVASTLLPSVPVVAPVLPVTGYPTQMPEPSVTISTVEQMVHMQQCAKQLEQQFNAQMAAHKLMQNGAMEEIAAAVAANVAAAVGTMKTTSDNMHGPINDVGQVAVAQSVVQLPTQLPAQFVETAVQPVLPSAVIPSALPPPIAPTLPPSMPSAIPSAIPSALPSVLQPNNTEMIAVPKDVLINLVQENIENRQSQAQNQAIPPIKCRCHCNCGRYPPELLIVDKVMSDLLESSAKNDEASNYSQDQDFCSIDDKDKSKLDEILHANAAFLQMDIQPDSQPPTDIALRRLIRMLSRLSAFRELCRHDQSLLIKRGSASHFAIRSAMGLAIGSNPWYNSQIVSETVANFYNSLKVEWRSNESIMLILSVLAIFDDVDSMSMLQHQHIARRENNLLRSLLKRVMFTLCGEDKLQSANEYADLINTFSVLQSSNRVALEKTGELMSAWSSDIVEPLLTMEYDTVPYIQ